LAQQIDIDLTDEHWKIIKFLRADYKAEGETATLRRVQTVGGVPVKEQFALFPKKPAKKMADFNIPEVPDFIEMTDGAQGCCIRSVH